MGSQAPNARAQLEERGILRYKTVDLTETFGPTNKSFSGLHKRTYTSEEHPVSIPDENPNPVLGGMDLECWSCSV